MKAHSRRAGFLRRLALLDASLRLTTWRERAIFALVGVAAAVVLAALLDAGYRVGAHIGQPGWRCEQALKGAISCVPDPMNAPR